MARKKLQVIFSLFAVIFIIIIGVLLWPNRDVQEVSAGWWNDNWSYRKAIVINSNYVTGDLTDFPALISLIDTNLGAHAQADGDDIVFIDDEGKKLSHEIESFATTTAGSIATGTLVAWVKIPELSSTEDTVISMYYGNAGATNQQDVANVWDEDYKLVQHLQEDGTGTRFDSSNYDNDSNNQVGYDGDEATSTGKINGADDFDGNNDGLRIANQSYFSQAPFTVEFWVKYDQVPKSKGDKEYIIWQRETGDPWVSWIINGDYATNKFRFVV